MRMCFGSIYRVLIAGFCLMVLAAGLGYAFVSAEVGPPPGAQPAYPIYAPPGPKPDEGIRVVPTATTQPPAPAITLLPPPVITQLPSPAVVPPTSAAPARPAACGLLTDFEQFGTWKRGDEPYGTFVQASELAHSGVFSGRLNYNFPTPGNDYVVFLRNIPMGGAGQAVTAWVYGDNSGHYLNCWIKDAQGEVWSFTFGQIKHTGWQLMIAPLDVLGAWPNGHVSGPANGVLDYPISLAALVLDDAPDTYVGSGVIYIDDLSCAEVAVVPQPSPQVGPSPQAPVSDDCVITLLEPAQGREFGSETQNVTLRWSLNRALGPQEYFFVAVLFPHNGQTWYDGTWRDPSQRLPDGTRDTSWNLREYLCGPGFSDTGWYKWFVTVSQQAGPEKAMNDRVVCASEKRDFKWSGCVPTPSAGGSGEYDLYVRRIDLSTDHPSVGETVTAYIMIATDVSPDGGAYFPASRFRWRKDADSPWHEESCGDDFHYAKCDKTVSFSYDSPGEHNFKVEADIDNTVPELDENNNSRKVKLIVSP